MITGHVTERRVATIPLTVHGIDDHKQEIEAVIDTGFTGFLTLSSTLIETLGLVWQGREQAVLGDGSIQVFDVYAVSVLRDDQIRILETDASETEPLIGMALIYGHELRIQAIENGIVIL